MLELIINALATQTSPRYWVLTPLGNVMLVAVFVLTPVVLGYVWYKIEDALNLFPTDES
jgi:type III secretory pathway component EscR